MMATLTKSPAKLPDDCASAGLVVNGSTRAATPRAKLSLFMYFSPVREFSRPLHGPVALDLGSLLFEPAAHDRGVSSLPRAASQMRRIRLSARGGIRARWSFSHRPAPTSSENDRLARFCKGTPGCRSIVSPP